MRILVVTDNISPASGGPTRSVKGLCRALSEGGNAVTLFVITGRDAFDDNRGVTVVYQKMPCVWQFDVVHINGLWRPGLHQVAVVCLKTGVPYIVSPRGMLDPWALSVKWLKKKIALLAYQRSDLRFARAFHATSEAEAQHVKAAGFEQDCHIVPNGVSFPEEMPDRAVNSDVRTALFLSRLHPGKGLLTLADAWAKVKPVGWRMRVVGPDGYGHKKDVVVRLNELGIAGEWDFVDMLNDEEKWRAYRSSDLLVHPSVSENFGITIAEGLAAGLPVIATKGTPWAELEERQCGWWIDIGVEPLAKALKAAMALTEVARREMGERGRSLVEEKYTWKAVGAEMKEAYLSLKYKV